MMDERVILVNEKDEQIGTEEKIKAHEKALLHRAFSVYIFNSKGELLMQKRALEKYHCPGIWANTCCSHPREEEFVLDAAHRRLQEEMGFDCENLREVLQFVYKIDFDNGLSEHEYLHVFIGKCDAKPLLNEDEVCEYKWIAINDLKKDLAENPDKYAGWTRLTLRKLSEELDALDLN